MVCSNADVLKNLEQHIPKDNIPTQYGGSSEMILPKKLEKSEAKEEEQREEKVHKKEEEKEHKKEESSTKGKPYDLGAELD